MTKPTVVILAGGDNSRFFPLNSDSFKASMTVAGTPLIVRSLEKLADQGYKHVVIVANPRNLHDQGLQGLLKDRHLNLEIKWVEQTTALGMGDAVLKAREHLTGSFVVTSGYYRDLAGQIDQLIATNQSAALCAAPTDRPWEYGIFELDGDRPIKLVEKPAQGTEPSNLKIITTYLLDEPFLEILSTTPPSHYSFEAALNTLLNQETVGFVKLPVAPPSLKYAWDLFDFWTEAQADLHSKIDASARVADTVIIDETDGPVHIEAGAKVGHHTRLVGPLFLGQNATIGDFCLVRSSSIEAHAMVGAYTEVVRSLIMEYSTIHQSYLADSILGPHVKIGAGLITANKRFDREPVSTLLKGKMISTGRQALGIIAGQESATGIRVSTMPGVLIGARQQIMPSTLLTKNQEHTS